MPSTEGDPLVAVRAALADIDTAYRSAVARVDAEDDLDAAHTTAKELASHMRALSDGAAELRARTVRRIWAAERLSLADLGNRIGVSKTRAGQLLRDLMTKEGESTDG